MINKVRKKIIKEILIPRHGHVVVGISGGPDSLALAHVLVRLSKELDFSVSAAHIDHGLRGEESDADSRFVEEWCDSVGFPLTVRRVDVKAIAAERSMSEEEAGRTARQDVFAEVADAVRDSSSSGHTGGADAVRDSSSGERISDAGAAGGSFLGGLLGGSGIADTADVSSSGEQTGTVYATDSSSSSGLIGGAGSMVRIAVAHNLEDQAETILMRILRGTGTDGLVGMSVSRTGGKGYIFIRPLLDISRTEIESYCAENGLTPRRDSTNKEAKYHRNLMRLQVIPAIEEAVGQPVSPALVRLGHNAAEDRDYFENLVSALIDEHCRYQTPDTSEYRSDNTSECRGEDTFKCRGANALVPRAVLMEMHPAVRHRFIRKVFSTIGLIRDISAVHLTAADDILMRDGTGKSIDFPGGYRFALNKPNAVFISPAEGAPPTRVIRRS